MNSYKKSPMNYTGGKYKLLPQILPLFPKKSHMFVDLFCGGGDIFSNIEAEKIIANDLDSNVISIYKQFQEMTIDEVLQHIDSTIAKWNLSKENAEGYLAFREYYNNSDRNPLDLFVLICHSFNNQIRFNKDGKFNMPFGKNRSSFNKNIRANLLKFHDTIRQNSIVFTSKSFEDLKIDKLSSNDFVYCDPPYLITCATYNEQGGWQEKDEYALLSLLDTLNENGVKFALSNVISNKGKTNEILLNWSEKYTVHHLTKTYSNCSYHAIDRNTESTDEVLVVNY